MNDPDDPRLASAEAWRAVLAALARAEQRVLGPGAPTAPRDRAEGFRHLLRFLVAGHLLCVEHADPDAPRFARMVDPAWQWGLDMPDCLYLFAALRGDAVYRVWGSRGTAKHVDFQVNWGHFALGDIAAWGTVSSVSDLELNFAVDGSFELWLGGPARPRNWLPVAPNAEFLLVRQYFADWEREQPGDLAIERVDGGSALQPMRSDQIAARLERLVTWIDRGGALWDRMSRGLVEGMAPNSFWVTRPEESNQRAGLRGQVYGMGNFHCASDEAVIVRFHPPPCRHWSVSLANWWWESLDFGSHQTSLNAHQAQLDADGAFRGVIAHVDPGIPNWLDTAGHERGTLAIRFLLAEEAPKVELERVALAELAAALPLSTPRVAPSERAAQLKQRRDAVWRRYRG
ncbi:MAG TPA: hypothetical protein DEP35_14575 [Deltaproteobacteria bacterium]|nr:hypothetical protein [Deltaproteobacteria bacterium]